MWHIIELHDAGYHYLKVSSIDMQTIDVENCDLPKYMGRMHQAINTAWVPMTYIQLRK